MKLLVLLLISSVVLAENKDECVKQMDPEPIEDPIKAISINKDYINLMARQIFNDKTAIYDFVGVDCRPSFENIKGQWTCFIRQSATKYEEGHYTVNPPHVGEWMIYLDFNENTYIFKKR